VDHSQGRHMPELRKDPVVGRWVIISTERSRRPTNFTPEGPSRAASFSPFADGREDMTPPEVYAVRPAGGKANGPGWSVRVVPNKFPALEIEGSLDRRGEGMYDKMNGVGAHEVVIEGSDPEKHLADLSVEHIQQVAIAWRERMLDLKKDRRLRYCLVFKNHGSGAGATLDHAHSQIIATPIIPRMVQEELDGARRYYELKERCVFSDIIDQDMADGGGRRLVSTTERFVAIAPFAPRFPFETWILPRARRSSYHTIDDPNEFLDFARILKDTLMRMNVALDTPPFNLILHTAPMGEDDLPYYQWHVEIMPKLTRVAGFEIGSGFYINPTPPEDAAQYMREIVALT
jgi:UDPglucose--hexose-1-phosphate uridylyltransferase